MLPPVDRVSGPVSVYLANDTLGLPKDTTFPAKPYSASLSLDYVSRPDIAVGASSTYGVGVAGGTALFWSDMLGEHNLTTVLSINGTLKDIGGGIGYQNPAPAQLGHRGSADPYQFATYDFSYGPTRTSLIH